MLLSILISLLRTGVPTIASAKAAQKQVAEYLNKRGARLIYELGSGKGDFVFSLAKNMPKAKVVGLELSPVPFLVAKIRWFFSPNKERITFLLTDFNKVDLTDADGVAFYLMPGTLKKIKPKLQRELKKGSIVASISFSMSSWRPNSTLKAPNFSKTQSFIYEMPALASNKNSDANRKP